MILLLVLDISEEEADKLKKQYGLAMKSFIDNDNEILLSTCKDENRKIIKKFLINRNYRSQNRRNFFFN